MASVMAQPVLIVAASLAALAAYAAALVRNERAAHALHWALLVGWLAHGLAIAVETSGVGTTGQGARFGFAPRGVAPPP